MADIDLSTLTPRDQDTNDQIVVMKEGSPDEMGLVPRARFMSGQVVTAAPDSDQANWAPSGFGATSAYIKLQPTTNSFISGITAGATDQFVTLFNDSTFLVALDTESGASTASNRFKENAFGSVFILPQESVVLRYSGTLSRWVVVSQSRSMYLIGSRTMAWHPSTSTTVNFGLLGASTTTPTVSTIAATATPTNEFDEYPVAQVTNSTASGTASIRANSTPFMRGATADRQGFFFTTMVRFPALGATGAVRVGVTNAVAVSTTLNAAHLRCILLGADTSDTTLSLYHNDASGLPDIISLGANFPVPDATAAYEFALYAPPASAFVRYMVRRIDSRFVAEGSMTSNIPIQTESYGPRLEIMVGATATASTAQMAYMIAQGL